MSPAKTTTPAHFRRGKVVTAIRLHVSRMRKAEQEMHEYAALVAKSPDVDHYRVMLAEYTAKYKAYSVILHDLCLTFDVEWGEVEDVDNDDRSAKGRDSLDS